MLQQLLCVGCLETNKNSFQLTFSSLLSFAKIDYFFWTKIKKLCWHLLLKQKNKLYFKSLKREFWEENRLQKKKEKTFFLQENNICVGGLIHLQNLKFYFLAFCRVLFATKKRWVCFLEKWKAQEKMRNHFE
jgi:hypothetical protein